MNGNAMGVFWQAMVSGLSIVSLKFCAEEKHISESRSQPPNPCWHLHEF